MGLRVSLDDILYLIVSFSPQARQTSPMQLQKEVRWCSPTK